MKNYFEILNVSESAELEVIQASYKALVKKYHPDNTNVDEEVANEKMSEINEAYDVLSDEKKRMEYIEKLKAEKGCELKKEGEVVNNKKEDINNIILKESVVKKANKQAIWSLILGIITWIGLMTIILPIFFGICSIVNGVKACKGKTKYKKCAIAGCVLSILFFIFLIWAIVFSSTNNKSTNLDNTGIEVHESEEDIVENETNIIETDIISGTLSVDVENEVLYSDEQGRITNKAGEVLVEYNYLTVLENGAITDGECILEGYFAGAGGKIILDMPGDVNNVTDEQDEVENDVTVNTNVNDLPIYSMDYLNTYIEMNGIDIPAVMKKTQMEKALSNDSEMISLKTSTLFWGDGIEYSATNELTELQYVGEMKDNKPHGWGRIMKLVSATEYEDEQGTKIEFGEYYEADDYLDLYIVLLYVGEFKNGCYDGYGWEYITPFTNSDDLANSIYYRDLGYDYVHIGDDVQQNILNTCNPVGYMGEFKDGEYHGDGIMIQYPVREIPIDMDVEEQERLFGARLDREIVIYVSEYSNGQRKGDCKEYMFGKLLYSGIIEDGYYNKKGTLYYGGSDQKKYEGEWRTGKYHGKGTLYNEDGSVSYSGEWDMGDYAE